MPMWMVNKRNHRPERRHVMFQKWTDHFWQLQRRQVLLTFNNAFPNSRSLVVGTVISHCLTLYHEKGDRGHSDNKNLSRITAKSSLFPHGKMKYRGDFLHFCSTS